MRIRHMVWVLLLLLPMGCENQAPADRHAPQTGNEQFEPQARLVARHTAIVGRVELFEDKVVILAEGYDYDVDGRDLIAMAGKMVRVTGALFEKEDGYTIQVLTVEEIE